MGNRPFQFWNLLDSHGRFFDSLTCPGHPAIVLSGVWKGDLPFQLEELKVHMIARGKTPSHWLFAGKLADGRAVKGFFWSDEGCGQLETVG